MNPPAPTTSVRGPSIPRCTRTGNAAWPQPGVPKLRGYGLVAALLLAALFGAGGLLAGVQLRTHTVARAQLRSMEVLALAREALLGYALSYVEHHADKDYGFLPCPDSGNDGSTPPGACGARDVGALGRLPWRTLGLPDLRDGWGQCLWYAVGGSVKNNPKPLTLNWDSPGQLAPRAPDGRALRAAGPDGLAVAAIFAPGPVLPGQSRPPGAKSGCGGSASAEADLAHYLDHGYTARFSATMPVTQGAPIGDDAGLTTDLVIWIGIDDIFDALRRRAGHGTYIDALIDTAADALAARLSEADFLAAHTSATPGVLDVGPLPSAAALGLPAAEGLRLDRWRDQFRFAVCRTGTPCIALAHDAPPATANCRGVLLFGGERIRSGPGLQQRDTPERRADPAQYLEADNAANFNHGTPSFSGAHRFEVDDPLQPATRDVIRCLP